MKKIFAIAYALTVISTPAFAWEVGLDQENAFGDKSVLITDKADDKELLDVSCFVVAASKDSNNGLAIGYKNLRPMAFNAHSFPHGEEIQAELFIKLDDANALILPVRSDIYLPAFGWTFYSKTNSDDTKKAVQAMSSAKGKILIGVKLPDGTRVTSTFGSNNVSLLQKAIDACK